MTKHTDDEIAALRAAFKSAEDERKAAIARYDDARAVFNSSLMDNAHHDFEAAGGVIGLTPIEVKHWNGWKGPYVAVGFTVGWHDDVRIITAPMTKSGKPHAVIRDTYSAEDVRIIKDAAP